MLLVERATNVRKLLVVVLSLPEFCIQMFAKLELWQVDVINVPKERRFSNTCKTLAGMKYDYVINDEMRVKHIIKYVGKHSGCQY